MRIKRVKKKLTKLKRKHQLYIRSMHWAQIREKKMALTPNCEECGEPATDVHHWHYHSLGREQPYDLVSVCRECHRKIHGKKETDE